MEFVCANPALITADTDTPPNLLEHARVLLRAGDPHAALTFARQAASTDRRDHAACLLLGELERQHGHLEAAETAYCRAVLLRPQHADGWARLGEVLEARNTLDEALTCFRRAIDLDRDCSSAWYHAARLRLQQDQPVEALNLLDRTLRLEPQHPEARTLRADTLQLTGRPDTTITELPAQHDDTAAALAPPSIESSLALARQHLADERHQEALSLLEHCLHLRPDHPVALLELIHLHQRLCDWNALPDAATQRELVQRCTSLPDDIELPSLQLVQALPAGLSDAELAPLARARAAALKRQVQRDGGVLPARIATPRSRLRLAYASADFHDHATLHLLRGLFAAHRRSHFEIHVYSWGPDDHSNCRRQLMADVDHFHEVRELDDAALAARIAADGIDILIDLNGHADRGRPGVFARRPAPLQLSWLGWPGTSGGDWFDALLTDRIVTPPQEQGAYTEPFAYLPHSVQCTDRLQPAAHSSLTRRQCSLPDEALVLACFCAHHRIDQALYACWMRLLHAEPTAVLWLAEGAEPATQHLQQAARDAGVNPARIIFAPRWPRHRHLERLRLADLFLDTRSANGRSSISDALWAGVPVVTLTGTSYASRLSASLLDAVGLPCGITEDLESCEMLVRHLLRYPSEIQEWRDHLDQQRDTCPLFDTPRFTRDLEALLIDLWQQQCEKSHQNR